MTVGLRIHKGMPIESLDQAASSLALQTYRKFKTVLLVDGPWEYGEKLAERYDLPLICTGEEPDITHCSWLHRQAVEQCDTEFYKPLDYDDQFMPGLPGARGRHAGPHKRGRLRLPADDAAERASFAAAGGRTSRSRRCSRATSTTTSFRTRRSCSAPKSSATAGNYSERAVGLGADDYNLWYPHPQGGRDVRPRRRSAERRLPDPREKFAAHPPAAR